MIDLGIDLAKHGIELHAWPPRIAGERSRVRGVIALHRRTGIAVRANEAENYAQNCELAVGRLIDLLFVQTIQGFQEYRPKTASHSIEQVHERHIRGKK